jgi:transketolase
MGGAAPAGSSPQKATRDGFGEGLLELGKTHPNVVALSGDLEDSARAVAFKKQYPERFGAAAGLAIAGKIPFACSFSQFVTGKTLEQMRMAVCYQKLNVKIVGSHGGLSVGADGATAEALEEFTVLRSLPGMAVVVPADALEAKRAAIASADHPGPVYLRLGRAPVPQVTKESEPFQIGRANVLRGGEDLTLIACGAMVAHALQAAELLARDRINARVVNMHTIKPIDRAVIASAARETGAIVTVEEHTIVGGLGGAVAEVVVQTHPVPMRFVGTQDRFGTSGDPAELLKAFHLMPDDIVKTAKDALRAKQQPAGSPARLS